VSIAQWETLEARVQQLEAWAGPGQIQALTEGQRALRAEMAKVQATLDRHGRILTKLKADMSGVKTDVATLRTDVATLKTDVATLKTDVATLKTDVATLKTDVATLKTDVATLNTRVATLETDMAWVKEALAELLRRTPPLPPSAN
jgi:mediator of RNA polymerase II transcription subunit 25